MIRQVVALVQLRPFRNAYLLRSLLIGAGFRLALAFRGAADLAFGAELGVLACVAGAVVLDARRRGEDLVLGNLGISTWTILLLVLPMVALVEALVP